MGAMRLPRQHSPTFDLISYVNSEIKEVNKSSAKPYPIIELRDYFFDSRDARYLNVGPKQLNDDKARNASIYYSKDNDKIFQKKDLISSSQ